MDDATPGRWIAPASGIVATGFLVLTVGVYAHGLSDEGPRHAAVRATFPVPPQAVWSLLADPNKRPEWRPDVDRIGRIEDREGLEVWRELDASGDRFDFVIRERSATPPMKLVLEVGAPEQLGMHGTWTFDVRSPEPSMTEVILTEDLTIPNPFWRGLSRLTWGPYQSVEQEIALLEGALGNTVAVERL